MTTRNRERRDWTLLIFIIPIGILLIIIVGQLAARLMPFWTVDSDMNSNLEPNPNSARPFALLEPILPQILTPMSWMETYLTPGAGVSFVPFLTFEPTASPSPTAATPTATNESPTPVATTGTPAPTTVSGTPPTATQTDLTPKDPRDTSTPVPSATTSSPSPSPSPSSSPSPSPSSSPSPSPSPDGLCHDPHSNNDGGPLPCDYGSSATPDPNYILATAPPETGVGTLPNNDPSGPPENGIGAIADGTYIVIGLSIKVETTPDTNYDLVYYEWAHTDIYMDWIIIGISKYSDGSQYYEVFNWGNGGTPVPDLNSNVGDVTHSTGTENDDQWVAQTEFYDPDGAQGPAPQSGILIDVDNAPSNPPPDTYNYVVIISPTGGLATPPLNPAQVDSIQTVEVPIPP